MRDKVAREPATRMNDWASHTFEWFATFGQALTQAPRAGGDHGGP